MTSTRRSFLVTPMPLLAGAMLTNPRTDLHAESGEPDDPKLTIRATVGRVEYRQLEPFEVTVTVENKTDRHMYFPFASSNKYLHIELTIHMLSRGKRTPTSRTQYFQRVFNAGSPGKFDVGIPPGEKLVYALIPNLVTDMTLQGRYEITAEVEYSVNRAVPREKRKVRTEPIVLDIAGREPFVSRRI